MAYELVNWQNNDDITADKLNQTDKKVKEISDKIDNGEISGGGGEDKLDKDAQAKSADRLSGGYNFNAGSIPKGNTFKTTILNVPQGERVTSVRPFVGKSYAGLDGTNYVGLGFAVDGFTSFLQIHPTNMTMIIGGINGNDTFTKEMATKQDVEKAQTATWTLLRDYVSDKLDKDDTASYEGWRLSQSYKNFTIYVCIICCGTFYDTNVNLATFPVNILEAFLNSTKTLYGEYYRDGSPNWIEIGREGTTETFLRRLNSAGVVYQIWGINK